MQNVGRAAEQEIAACKESPYQSDDESDHEIV